MRSKDFKYMPAYLFCVMIFIIPILYIAVPDSDFSPLEKRKLSQLPVPSVKTVFDGSFGEDFETYLNDQMPMRTFFVGTNAYYDKLGGRNGMSGIYSGSADYLFTAPVKAGRTFENNLRFIGEFLESETLPCYVCTVPSAGYIYSGRLPKNHYEYNDGDITEKIRSEFSAYDNVTFIDITDDFKQTAQTKQLYYKTDHHWTSRGAYECYRILGGKMGFTPADEDTFAVESYGGFHGTNYSKAALWFTPSETLELWNDTALDDGSVTVEITEAGETKTYNTLFFRENLKTDDMYTAFLDGNHALVKITNPKAKSDKKLLLLRDSYSHCLAPFLAEEYSEIVLADMRYYLEPVSELAQTEGADEILLLYSLDSMVNSTELAGIY